MMEELKITLIGDGSSDKALGNIVKWLIDDLFPRLPNKISFADFRRFPEPPARGDTKGQFEFARDYYPFDLLIYHRDAESNAIGRIAERKDEVLQNLEPVHRNFVVCLVPVKMMETWLLFDSEAIKRAAGNRNYTGELALPALQRLEKHTTPKECLHNLLKEACGKKGRQLKTFNVHQAVHLVAENIADFSALRGLHAFRFFETDLKSKIEEMIK